MVSQNLRFERLDRRYEECMIEFAKEFRAEGDPRLDLLLDDPDGFFARADRFERGLDLPEDRVPISQFVLSADDRLVAMSRLRRRLIPVLLLDGGNIGYEVRPSTRRKGFGSEILRRTMAEASGIGLDRVLVTTELTNLGSIRVIEKAGGVPDSDSVSSVTGESMRRYWISLSGSRTDVAG